MFLIEFFDQKPLVYPGVLFFKIFCDLEFSFEGQNFIASCICWEDDSLDIFSSNVVIIMKQATESQFQS